MVLLQTCICLNKTTHNQKNGKKLYSFECTDTISLLTFFEKDPNIYVESRVTKDSTIYSFKINTLCDTIFLKKEYVRHSDIDVSNPLVVWGEDQFYYSYEFWDVPYNRKKQFENRDSLKSFILTTHDEFFKLVQSWDTTTMRALERSIPCTAHYSTDLYRIIFRNRKYKIDKFEFKDLDLPHLDKEGNTNYDITSTVLIQN